MDIEELIDNNESEELLTIIKRYFNNDFEFFFNYILEEGLIPDDIVSDTLFDIFPNEYIKFLLNQKKYEIVKQYFASVVSDIVYKDDKYYLEVYPVSSLHRLFQSRQQDFIEQVLEGDYYVDDYDVSAPTDELVDNLTPENKKILIKKIKEQLLDSKIEYNGDSELIESFIESDNNGDNSFILTTDRLYEIVNEKLLPDLIDNINDFKNDLEHWYCSAWSQAHDDVVYEAIYNKLHDFFGVSKTEQLGEYATTTKYTRNGMSDVTILLIDITKLLISFIDDSVSREVGYWDNTERITGVDGSLFEYLCEYYTIGYVNFDYLYASHSDIYEIYNDNFYENT